MGDRASLAEGLEAHRARLRAMALRMLGSSHEADDALQEAWLRCRRAETQEVDNLGGFLTTLVGRICLDVLRARSARGKTGPGAAPPVAPAPSPEDEALVADSVGRALAVVLDTLGPAERLSLVLHDVFAVPFEEIGPIVGRSPVAARQLASRARRRVQADPSMARPSVERQREVVGAFLAAARHGDFAQLLELLDPEVVLRADAVALSMASARAGAGAPRLGREVHGPDAVSRVFAGGARAARLTLVDGLAGAVFSAGGRPQVVFDFVVRDGRVLAIELLADPETLAGVVLEPWST